ncbi:DUF6030 family protein [Fulvimarina sp. 2208YS6-2-32]|uniref:DUF6030 family protein n=1 Tax=Fulvimarina uroteuthidis TaxID=3098149 RepID=A0ABU5I4F8_9HYPH|nr:DUF6030 family protein [Fulvimarina sp. 2208YS6-2-32]MDY8110269.1 DUF6030 family protein [Fulvimarina sp. 2208YS6-2-32]
MNRWNQADRFRLLKTLVGEHRTAGELANRFVASTSFRFILLAVAISCVTFAVRTSDAFQSAQFAALKAETKERVASASDITTAPYLQATQMTAAEPRLLKPVALKSADLPPAEPDAPAAAAAAAAEDDGIADPVRLCKAFDGANWNESTLFSGQKECFSRSEGKGFALAQIARGTAGDRVDTIRMKLDVESDDASDEAGSSLSENLDEALEIADISAPSSFLESVAKLESARAEAGELAFKLEQEVGSPNRFTLIVEKKEDEKNPIFVQLRP